jgi:uncharacterized protein (DUF433 family)
LLVGKPVIRGTRLAVEFVIGLLADGWAEADILINYPNISHDDIIACLAYARDMLSTERVYTRTARLRLRKARIATATFDAATATVPDIPGPSFRQHR